MDIISIYPFYIKITMVTYVLWIVYTQRIFVYICLSEHNNSLERWTESNKSLNEILPILGSDLVTCIVRDIRWQVYNIIL